MLRRNWSSCYFSSGACFNVTPGSIIRLSFQRLFSSNGSIHSMLGCSLHASLSFLCHSAVGGIASANDLPILASWYSKAKLVSIISNALYISIYRHIYIYMYIYNTHIKGYLIHIASPRSTGVRLTDVRSYLLQSSGSWRRAGIWGWPEKHAGWTRLWQDLQAGSKHKIFSFEILALNARHSNPKRQMGLPAMHQKMYKALEWIHFLSTFCCSPEPPSLIQASEIEFRDKVVWWYMGSAWCWTLLARWPTSGA